MPTTTHAQNLRLRRLANSRQIGYLHDRVGKRGEPIAGPLTAIEIAHKARRRQRRMERLRAMIAAGESAGGDTPAIHAARAALFRLTHNPL
jgi:uncharacterized Ntn-hydrolase superfamily protein